MTRTSKEETHFYLRQRARELALSGTAVNYVMIEAILASEGYPGAAGAFSQFEMNELDELCERFSKPE